MRRFHAVFWSALLLFTLAPGSALAEDTLPHDLRSLYEQVRPAVVRIAAGGAYGSGFVIEDGAQVATAWHVVEGAQTVFIETEDGTELKATVLDWDREADTAILQLEQPVEVTPLTLSDRVPQVGDALFAVGHPLIGPEKLEDRHEGLLEWSFTSGMVSVVGAQQIQTTVMLHPGNSGCPVFDEQGQVVGIAVETAGAFGLVRKVDVLQDLLAEDRVPPKGRVHVAPYLAFRGGGAFHPGLAEDRQGFAGVGAELGMTLGHRLVLAARLDHGWLTSRDEREAGRPGRHGELSFLVGPSFDLARNANIPVRLRLQPYFTIGYAANRTGQRTETIELLDPDCDPGQGPCAMTLDEDTTWRDHEYLMMGGGLRLDLGPGFFDLGTTFDPADPAGTFSVGLRVGLRFGRP